MPVASAKNTTKTRPAIETLPSAINSFRRKFILDNDFEVLLINPCAQLVGFRLVFVGNPDLSYRPGQIDACRVELVGSVVDLVAVFLQLRFIGRIGLCGFTQV
jgi:hypothetical protein